jgi:hypothetical protein
MDEERSGRKVFTIPKNAREEIHFTLTEYQKKRLCDIRVFYLDEAGEAHPTKKGLSLRPELLSKVREGIRLLEQAVKSEQESELQTESVESADCKK